jgi:hypothetical protein
MTQNYHLELELVIHSSPKNHLPCIERHPFGTLKLIKDGTKIFVLVSWQLQGLSSPVDDPAKEQFCSAPTAVTFE